MYKKEELLEYENRFAKAHLKGLIVMLLYLVVDVFRNFSVGTPFFFRTAIACLALVAEQLLRPFDFFKSVKVVNIMKYIQALVFAMIFMRAGYRNYEYVIYIILYVGIMLEMMISLDLMENGKVVLYIFLSVLPLVIMGTIYIVMDFTIDSVLAGIVTAVSMGLFSFIIATCIRERSRRFERAIFAKDRMIDNAMDINKEIMDKQDKLYYVNEQLGIKRIEIEAANRRINANNLEINIQNKLLRFFNSTHDVGKINAFFAEELINEMGLKCAGLLKIDEEGKNSIYEEYKRSNEDYDDKSRYKMFGSYTQELCDKMLDAFASPEFIADVLGGEMYVCNNVKRTDYLFLADEHIMSFAVKSILVDEKIIGVYVFCHEETGFFEERDKYFDNILYQLQVALNNSFLYLRFEDMAKKDGLTGLYNRRIFNETMAKYRNPDEETRKESIVAAMFDIDNFKKINDTYGHLFGDVAIKSVSGIIRKVAAGYGGLGYRYGGEEFVVIFFAKKLADVIPVIEEIHKTIRETEISMDDISLYINTSAGVSAYPEINDVQITVIDSADKAMYISKTTGKGKITVAE